MTLIWVGRLRNPRKQSNASCKPICLPAGATLIGVIYRSAEPVFVAESWISKFCASGFFFLLSFLTFTISDFSEACHVRNGNSAYYGRHNVVFVLKCNTIHIIWFNDYLTRTDLCCICMWNRKSEFSPRQTFLLCGFSLHEKYRQGPCCFRTGRQ